MECKSCGSVIAEGDGQVVEGEFVFCCPECGYPGTCDPEELEE